MVEARNEGSGVGRNSSMARVKDGCDGEERGIKRKEELRERGEAATGP